MSSPISADGNYDLLGPLFPALLIPFMTPRLRQSHLPKCFFSRRHKDSKEEPRQAIPQLSPLNPQLINQLTAAKRSTRQAASREMAVDIFESPSRRSVKTMGTSLIVNPCFHAVWCNSI